MTFEMRLGVFKHPRRFLKINCLHHSVFGTMNFFNIPANFVSLSSAVLKDLGRFHRFPAQSLGVSGGVCVICIEYLLYSSLNKSFDKCNNVLHTFSINLCQRERVIFFFKKLFGQKTCFAIHVGYEENTTIC